MNDQKNSMKLLCSTMFKLLPVQILLSALSSVNELVSSFFANNYIGSEAMSAVGLYIPINILLLTPNTMLIMGSSILIGQYWGKNDQKKLQAVFSTTLFVAFCIGLLFLLIFSFLGFFGLTGFITRDPILKANFNQYLLSQCIGILPLLLGSLLSTFISMENRRFITFFAGIMYILSNIIFHYIFINILGMNVEGLGLAASLSSWVFFLILIQYFFSKKAHLRFSLKNISKNELFSVIKVGYPKLFREGYQTMRGFFLNFLLGIFVGTAGISSFAISRNVINLFWAAKIGMIVVSTMMIGISVGEEDKQTLLNSIKTMIKKFTPLLVSFCLLIIIFAKPIIKIFFSDKSDPSFMMTVWGLRLFAISMPLYLISAIFISYTQTTRRQSFVNLHFFLREFLCIAIITLILMPIIGFYSIYIAFIITPFILYIHFFLYSCIKRKKIPRKLEDLLLIPLDFGAKEEDRMDLTIKSIEEVITIAKQIQPFCLKKGIDERRSYIAALVLEEMAGNIIAHGFNKDKKEHYIDIRIVIKNDNVILRLKDNCIPFDPKSRQNLTDNPDITKNIGLRIVFKIAKDLQYQNLLGLNCLSIKI